MDDQLDNDLKRRINEVFEQFEDTSADEGWLLLREKYPKKAKRRAAGWLWWAAAAAVLLFLGIFWLNYTPANPEQIAGGKKQPAKSSIPKPGAEQSGNSIVTDSTMLHRPNQEAITANYRSAKPTLKGHGETTYKIPAVDALHNPAFVNPALTKPNGIAVDSFQEMAIAARPKMQNNIITPPVSPNEGNVDTGAQSPIKTMAVTTVPGIDMRQITKTNSAILTDHGDRKVDKKQGDNDKAIRFAVYAATYFNYAKGSSNQLNVGAGFTSDIKLSKNLQFSTGVAIAQNTLSYNDQIPSAAPAALATNSLTSKNAFNAEAAVPSIKNYNANLVGLDIPLNLKYVFNPQKSDTYISAGLSSGTFINEKYTYSYNYSAPFSQNGGQVQDQTTNQSFNSFYFAKTLNFSFGVGYPLGRNKLIIEPFIKYPLTGLGSQDIRFGAGGLNLKFNFLKK